MIETLSHENHILEEYKIFNNNNINDSLSDIRELAISRFNSLKFPKRKHEMFTYVDLKELISIDFAYNQILTDKIDLDYIKNHIYKGCEESIIVIVNGIYNETLSNTTKLNNSITINITEKAITNNKIKNYLFETIRREEDVFAVINNSFMTNGLTIEIKPNNRLSKPLQILNVSIGSENKQLCLTPRIIIEFGTLSEGTVITKYIGNKGNYFVNAMHDFIIQEGAIVKNCNIQSDPYDTWHFLKTNITMLKDSKLHLTDVPHGNKLQRHNIKANLQAEGAELNINVASILNSNQQIHKCVRVHHEATHCSSKQIFKNIIKDHGHSSVDTTVIVHEGAQQTNSDQLINNLLLSDNAKADVKPNLMIYADDVKCTHGATTGQIDKDQIFYLKSRGLSDFEANKLLTSSFIKSIIDGIEYKPIVEELYQTLLKKLEE